MSEFTPNPTEREIDVVAAQRGVPFRMTEPDGIEVRGRIYAVSEPEQGAGWVAVDLQDLVDQPLALGGWKRNDEMAAKCLGIR